MRQAFTLIELIFVIVIIGLLSAVAVPKFLKLKQSAEATNVSFLLSSVPPAVEAASSYAGDDNNSFTLKDILKMNGKGWEYNSSIADGDYQYIDPVNKKKVMEINLTTSNYSITYEVNCSAFSNTDTQTKCEKVVPQSYLLETVTYQ